MLLNKTGRARIRLKYIFSILFIVILIISRFVIIPLIVEKRQSEGTPAVPRISVIQSIIIEAASQNSSIKGGVINLSGRNSVPYKVGPRFLQDKALRPWLRPIEIGIVKSNEPRIKFIPFPGCGLFNYAVNDWKHYVWLDVPSIHHEGEKGINDAKSLGLHIMGYEAGFSLIEKGSAEMNKKAADTLDNAQKSAGLREKVIDDLIERLTKNNPPEIMVLRGIEGAEVTKWLEFSLKSTYEDAIKNGLIDEIIESNYPELRAISISLPKEMSPMLPGIQGPSSQKLRFNCSEQWDVNQKILQEILSEQKILNLIAKIYGFIDSILILTGFILLFYVVKLILRVGRKEESAGSEGGISILRKMKEMKCKTCQFPIDFDAKYCQNCGAIIEKVTKNRMLRKRRGYFLLFLGSPLILSEAISIFLFSL